MEDEFLLKSPWAQLVSTRDGEEVVPVVGDRLSIGRKRGLADLVVEDNKHVSGCHCVLNRGSTLKPTLKDTSSNGTLLNHKRLRKGVEVELAHNDVITLVHRKDDPSLSVDDTLSYEGEDMEMEEDGGGEGEEEGEEEEEEDVEEDSKKRKRPLADEDCSLPSAKVAPTPVLGDQLVPDKPEPPGTGDTPPGTGDMPPGTGDTPPGTGGTGGEDTGDGEGGVVSKPSLVKLDSMEESLLCHICQEILHNCVSLQPCMHSYCAGCYSKWMDNSSLCPACRTQVKRISKNHIVNNLVSAYLRSHPTRRRPSQDLQELDADNKITHDMLYPKKSRRFDYDDDEDDDDDDDEDDDDNDSFTFHPLPPTPPVLALCRQCPQYNSPLLAPGPSSYPYPFSCSLPSPHVLCQCCSRPMPDRLDPSIPQKCEVCSNYFCHMYWGCERFGCSGCLAHFKDLSFNASWLHGILGNAYESTILKDYMESVGLTFKDFLQTCCENMDSGKFSYARMTPATICCQGCAQTTLRSLAYQYRQDIPSDALPNEVTSRVDCYWGKECRTQSKNPNHAKKFNHICEKTRQV